MSFSISGRTAIVTGAANGVGLAVARHFAREGANVMCADMDEAALQKELGETAEEHENLRLFSGDLSEKLSVTNLLSATIDAFERVDILVNAARQVEETNILDACDTTLDEMLNQNVKMPYRLIQAVAKRFIKQAEGQKADGPIGSIVNLGSISARRAHPNMLAFSVSAAALDQLTRSTAVGLAEHNIRVNSVAIGSVMSTGMKLLLRDRDDLRQSIVEATPLKRIASAGEVVEAIQYLASDAAGFVTGQTITVDGGRTLIDPVGVVSY
jgi:7-alpha-hydroxysteroid dehydrogenase